MRPIPGRMVRRLALGLLSLVSLATLTTFSVSAHANLVVDPELRIHLAKAMSESIEQADRFDAEVWLLASETRLRRYVKDADKRLTILKTVFAEAGRHSLDADLVLAVMHMESMFKQYAISSVGAQGLMQVMPFWRLEIGRPQDNLTDVKTNIRYGTAILAHYLEVSKGDLVEALGRYNGSRGRLKYPERVIRAWRKYWRNQTREDLPDLQESCTKYALNACVYQ